MAATRLRKIRLSELSLVDRPASRGADTLFWKRDDGMSVGSKFADLIKRIAKGGPQADDAADELSIIIDKGDEPDKKVAKGDGDENVAKTLEAVSGTLEAIGKRLQSIEAVQKADQDEKTALSGMTPEQRDAYATMSDEDKAKAREAAASKPDKDDEKKNPFGKKDDTVNEAVIQKAVDAATKPLLEQIQKMQAERETEALAKEWGPLAKAASMSEADLVALVKALPVEQREVYKKSLTATNALLEKSVLFHEIGKNHDGSAGGPEGKLENLAKAYSAEKGVSHAQAYDAVLKTEEGKRLYAESRRRSN